MTKCLLTVILPGADANAVNHLVDTGRLPNLQHFIESGATAPLDWSRLATYSGDMMTLMTGLLPHRHRAVTAHAPRADGYGPTLLDRSHLKATPLWEQWAAYGQSVAAINWPASLATIDSEAHVIADRFFQIEGIDVAPSKWPVFPRSVHPASDIKSIKALRVHPSELEQKLSGSPLASILPEAITPPDSKAAVTVSRLLSQVVLGSHYLKQDFDAVILNIDVLDRIGLPRSKDEADRILNYYGLVDAALSQLMEAASPGCSVALILRPPSAALLQPGSPISRNGQAVFVSPNHAPDSLLDPMIPTEIAPYLSSMMDISFDANLSRSMSESYPIDVVEPDHDLKKRLARLRPEPDKILKSTAAAHLKTHIIMEVEYFRSLIKDKGTAEALRRLDNRPDAFEEREVLYLNIAEQLIRDAKPQEARAFLDRPIDHDQATAWQLFLLANVCLLEGDTTKAATHLQQAGDLDPGNEQIAALMANLSGLKPPA